MPVVIFAISWNKNVRTYRPRWNFRIFATLENHLLQRKCLPQPSHFEKLKFQYEIKLQELLIPLAVIESRDSSPWIKSNTPQTLNFEH